VVLSADEAEGVEVDVAALTMLVGADLDSSPAEPR
jgi:hypothetical protein